MISLSKEWAALSRVMYGQEYIDELSALLDSYRVKTVLECGCGDGNILYGLAMKGFHCVGVDSNLEMISLCVPHPNIEYRAMDWLDLDDKTYDAVLCRGNSISCVVSWEKELDIDKARNAIKKSLSLFFQHLENGGLLYVDSIPNDEKTRDISISSKNLHINGIIKNDHLRKVRETHGKGIVANEWFEGCSESYLLTLSELKEMIERHNPSDMFLPSLSKEINYAAICAVK